MWNKVLNLTIASFLILNTAFASVTIQQSSKDVTSQLASTTSYYHIVGNISTTAGAEADRATLHRTGGTYSNLSIGVLSNACTTNSTLKTRKATADGNEVATITALTTGLFTDSSNTDAVTAGDDWHLQLITGGTGALTFGEIGILFSATSNTSQRIGYIGSAFSNPSATRLGGFFGSGSPTAADNSTITSRTDATLKNMLVYISANARTTATTFTSRKNGSAGAMSISITASTTGSFEDTANSDTIASGDTFSWQRVSGASSESCTPQVIAADFETTNGQSMQTCGLVTGLTQLANVTTKYSMAGNLAADLTELNVAGTTNLAFTASQLQCNILTNTVSDDSTLTLRKNSGSGAAETVTITASTTGIFRDNTNTDSVIATDTLDYQIVTGATGTSIVIQSISLLCDSSTSVASNQTNFLAFF